jgi:hypothetical protein
MSYSGLGADFPKVPSEELRAIQRDLLRLYPTAKYLTPSGLLDIGTMGALAQAKTALGRSVVGFKTTRTGSTIDDDFIEAIRAAVVAATPTPTPTPTPGSGQTTTRQTTTPTPGTVIPTPAGPATIISTTSGPAAVVETPAGPVAVTLPPPSNMKLYVIGGAVVVAGVVAVVVLRRRKKAVAANRRRRR